MVAGTRVMQIQSPWIFRLQASFDCPHNTPFRAMSRYVKRPFQDPQTLSKRITWKEKLKCITFKKLKGVLKKSYYCPTLWHWWHLWLKLPMTSHTIYFFSFINSVKHSCVIPFTRNGASRHSHMVTSHPRFCIDALCGQYTVTHDPHSNCPNTQQT